jgi:putative GTP pyrophosphokinase
LGSRYNPPTLRTPRPRSGIPLRGLAFRLRAASPCRPYIDRVSFRTKGGKSFDEKAHDPETTPPHENPLVEIEDQVAGRVIVFFLRDIEVVLEQLKRTFNTVERKHMRPKNDDGFGYESAHLICNIPPQAKPEGWAERDDVPHTFELQVRTIFMHAYAEPQHNIGYKPTAELPRQIKRELAWIAASAWGADQAFERVNAWNDGQGNESKPDSD